MFDLLQGCTTSLRTRAENSRTRRDERGWFLGRGQRAPFPPAARGSGPGVAL